MSSGESRRARRPRRSGRRRVPRTIKVATPPARPRIMTSASIATPCSLGPACSGARSMRTSKASTSPSTSTMPRGMSGTRAISTPSHRCPLPQGHRHLRIRGAQSEAQHTSRLLTAPEPVPSAADTSPRTATRRGASLRRSPTRAREARAARPRRPSARRPRAHPPRRSRHRGRAGSRGAACGP